MPSLRDQIVLTILFSAVEAYATLHFAPDFKPRGGLGRLAEWFMIANVIVLFTYRWYIWPRFLSPLRDLPGPSRGWPLIGQGMIQFSKPPGDILRKWVNEIPNDGLIHFNAFFGQDTVVATTHETLKAILSDHTYDYEKPSQFVNILRRILGDGLILVEGSVHKFQRKHLLPSFQLKQIKALYSMFWQKSCELTDMIASEKEKGDANGFEMEFGQWCMRATLDIIGIAGLGRDFGALKNPNDEIVAKYTEILEPHPEKLLWFGLSVIFPQWIINNLPWGINRELTAVQNYLHDFALNVVKDRRKELASEKRPAGNTSIKSDDVEPGQRADILSLLVRSDDFSDHELSEQVLTMMAAGHETTSSALSWCAYLLAIHPDVQERVREEVRAALPSPSSGQSLEPAAIDSLTWLNAACLEVVRLYPTVPVTIRYAINETPLGGKMLPKGSVVLLAPWAINRSEHFWGKDAGEFKPERWINDDGSVNKNGGSSSNYAQLTFLHGPRSCIGQGFAQSELKCLLAAFVGRYRFELARKGDEYFPAGLITTKPQGGMWLKLQAVPGWE